jgi:hypothetical protein
MLSYMEPDNFLTYKKLVNTLRTSFGYDLPKSLIGKSTIKDVIEFKNNVEEQQKFISEGTYEYTNPKYTKNVILLEALNKLINLLEIRTYRLEPKTGALVNFSTAADKLKALLNPKDNRPDLSYFTADHLNIEEPIKVVGQDDMGVEDSVTNAANQVAPEDNLKKAEVYVGMHDGDPNYTTPTNAAEEEKLAGLTSVEIANIADKVKADVKKDLAKEISNAALLQKRKTETVKEGEINYPTPHYPIGMIMKLIGCDAKTAHDVDNDMRYLVGGSGTLDHLTKKQFDELALRAYNGMKKELGEETMTKPIIKQLLESEMEKAEIVLGVKSMTDQLQSMAEKISKMQIEDIAALTERLKAEFGVEMGEQFQSEVSGFLASSLQALQASKSSIDNKALALSGDHSEQHMGSTAMPVEEPAAEELPGGEDEEDLFGGHEAEEGPEEAPLGRAKKEESVEVTGEAIMEAKKKKQKKDAKELAEKIYSNLSEAYKKEKDAKKKEEMRKKAKKLKESIAILEKMSDERCMGNTKKGSEEKKPTTPHNTAKILNPKAVNVKKK